MSFDLGQWKAECDRCGFWFKSRRLQREWTGLRVCGDCLDHRHPQERLRAKLDRQAPPWVRPADLDQDVSVGSGNEVEPGDL